MTGSEHYAEAERIIAAIRERDNDIAGMTAADKGVWREQRLGSLQMAQVHATLAHAAAVAYVADDVKPLNVYGYE
jgi:hypothetical protein